jgi:hypothetical protein
MAERKIILRIVACNAPIAIAPKLDLYAAYRAAIGNQSALGRLLLAFSAC